MTELAPKKPQKMKDVYTQIESHPRFSALPQSLLVGYMAARNGFSYRTRENNAWCRRIWDHLYLGTVTLEEL